MHFLFVLAALPALVTLLLVAGNGHKDDCPQTCKTPSKPFYKDIKNTTADILYIYNETSKLCEDTLIERGPHTFESRFNCVATCLTGQGAPLCVGDPVNAVNKCDITSNTVMTLDSRSDYEGDGNESSGYSFFELEKEFEAFFYNVTSMKCENYTAYDMPEDRNAVTNFFLSDIFCEYECGGFNISNIYGNGSNSTT
uniref:Pancreatic trypsin inhibitor n=1 Tax=Rhipicephalus zambeziensis TaxID=60191 RepID=A0A224YD68_9ACAR